MLLKKLVGILLIALFCSAAVSVTAEEVGDPLEGINHKIYAFNTKADDYLLKPIAKGYRKILPKPIRTGIGNFFLNFGYPVVAVNQFLQGKGRDGLSDTVRFLVNSTLGIGGLFDPASNIGLKEHEEGFSQTFAVWGIGSGPYLVVPLWGPSTVRGSVGSIADSFSHPMGYVVTSDPLYIGLSATLFINKRAELLDLESLIIGDKYIFIRDAYLQRQQFLINDGEIEDPFADDDF